MFSLCSQVTIERLHRNRAASKKVFLIADVQAKFVLNAVLLEDIYFATCNFK